MSSYQVTLNIEAQRVPDLEPDPYPPPIPGRDVDPAAMLPEAMNMLHKINNRAYSIPAFGPPPGLTLRKSFTVTTESFKPLCEMLERFDSLAEQVECSNPAE